jgi:hypothetical protein
MSGEGSIWGSDVAAVLPLIPQLWHKLELRWNYSDITRCDRVVLQFAGEDGFNESSDSPNVLSDSAVAAAYTGPANAIECLVPEYYRDLHKLGDSPGSEPCAASQAFDLSEVRGWEDEVPLLVYLRLVPVDSEGAQVDVASDPVAILCSRTWPGIAIRDASVTWIWGETPQRQIDFTLRLVGPFLGSFEELVDAPSTIVLCTMKGIHRNVRMTVDDTELTHQSVVDFGSWGPTPAYVMEIEDWVQDREYRCRLVQEWPLYSAPTLTEVGSFGYVSLDARCFPGISDSLAYCGGPMNLEECSLPKLAPDGASWDPEHIPCPPALGHYYLNDGVPYWDDLHEYFASTFEGTRTTTRIRLHKYYEAGATSPVRTETETLDPVEEEVTVQFEFPDNPSSGSEFRHVHHRDAIMRETLGGTARSYLFKWRGQYMFLQEQFGNHRQYHGERMSDYWTRIIPGVPDNLEMQANYEYTPSTNPEPHHYIVETDRIEYHLTRR